MKLKIIVILALLSLLYSCHTSVEEANKNVITEEVQDISHEEQASKEKVEAQKQSTDTNNVKH